MERKWWQRNSYNILNSTRISIGHYLLSHRGTADFTESLCSLFRPTWRTVLKMGMSLFWKGQVKASQNVKHKLLTIKKVTKNSFVDVENAGIKKKKREHS